MTLQTRQRMLLLQAYKISYGHTNRPRLLKQANLSLIRRVIKNRGTATRSEIAVETQISSTTVRSLLTEMMENGEIESIGVPGIVEGHSFWRGVKDSDAFCRTDLGSRIAERYRLPVIMENDLNATAIGFGRCYEREFPQESPDCTNMAYLHFEITCISAGFIAGGRIIRGFGNYAGELGLVPMEDGRRLDEWLAEADDDKQYTNLIITILCWVCAVLNPQYIVLGGPALRRECVGPISDGFSALLPKHMTAEILYSNDMWHDYHDGMAYLTAEKIFDDIQFIKEQL